ncbi:MAG: carbohydrate ABC transporter permease [Rhodospirillaceae bacterium]|nr:carbohydrate ABC transporter permease [Rhodospirillaceae bacterium]
MSPLSVALEWVVEYRPVWLRDRQIFRRRSIALVQRLLTYVVLIDICFVFLIPVFYILSTSLKTAQDLTDPTIYWIPHSFHWFTYPLAFLSMAYIRSLSNSLWISVGSAIGQTIACGFIGYGFARLKFPGRDILFGLVLFTFMVPPQTIIVPLFILYKNLGWINTFNPFLGPAFYGHGLRGAIFVVIFRQFYRTLPWELEEAARVDGASAFGIWWRIMLPLAVPAIVVVFLFSVVWHWNDFFEPFIYLNRIEHFTLPMRLSVLSPTLNQVTGGQSSELFNEALVMAAVFLVILPPLSIYLFTQRYFIESVDRTGLVE